MGYDIELLAVTYDKDRHHGEEKYYSIVIIVSKERPLTHGIPLSLC